MQLRIPQVCSNRLLYVVGQLASGGAERQLHYFLRELDRTRYRPAVVVWNYRRSDYYVRHLERLGVPIWGFRPTLSSVRKLQLLRALVVRRHVEVVHSYSFFTNVAAVFATAMRPVICVSSVRSDFDVEIAQSGPLPSLIGIRWADAVIFNSRNALQNAERRAPPFQPRRSFVVRNGLDLDACAASAEAEHEPPLLLGVGTLKAVKRWDRAIRLAGMLRRQGYRFRLRIAGDGPLREQLEQQVASEELGDVVELCGFVPDISAEMRRCTLLVHFADTEGCPNVVMEAMASGKPVVAMDAGDVRYLLEDGETGFVVPVGDLEAMLDRVTTLLDRPVLRAQMGTAARRSAERQFALDRLLNETLRVYGAVGWDPADSHEAAASDGIA